MSVCNADIVAPKIHCKMFVGYIVDFESFGSSNYFKKAKFTLISNNYSILEILSLIKFSELVS